jgi:3-hydroxyisobutyrate dehydrogenase-like beta-hydroxyacid dehydrogenase
VLVDYHSVENFVDTIVDNPLKLAILGLGEAGSAIAADLLAAGAELRGWDPVAGPELPGLDLARGAADAVSGAAIVLSVNRAAGAVALAAEVAPALAPGAIFADLNTAAPALKVAVAERVEGAGARFADVALLAPVPGRGLATPALASGSGAAAFVAALAPLGMPVEALGEQAGEAAERKLLRSIFAKGMAIAALESLAAARAAGCEEWLRGQLVATLTEADEGLLDRWLAGSRTHAARRAEEMAASAEMLAALGTPALIAGAAEEWFEVLAAEVAGAR